MTIMSIDSEKVVVKNEHGVTMTGLLENSSPLAPMNKGETIHVSIRPESILQGEGENTLTGEITFVEFTGSKCQLYRENSGDYAQSDDY